jgi:hypothetical protein
MVIRSGKKALTTVVSRPAPTNAPTPWWSCVWADANAPSTSKSVLIPNVNDLMSFLLNPIGSRVDAVEPR